MSLGIDAADIVGTGRIPVEPGDDYGRINSRAIVLGTSRMIQAIRDAEAGRLAAVAQWLKGRLYHNRDMNNFVAYRYHAHRDRYFETHQGLEREGRLPQVRLVP